jgi:hypothetical protein
VQEFAERYPGIVKPIYQEKNIGGGVHNFLTVHGAAIGKYVSHVDGDDYVLPGKLQTQANYLDQHPDYNIVWHRMYLLNQGESCPTEDFLDYHLVPKEGFSRKDILAIGSIGIHSSKMYRASCMKGIDFTNTTIDYEIDIYQIGHGKGVLLNHFFGVYRTGLGISSERNRKTRKNYNEILLRAAKRFPEFRCEINFNFLFVLLSDIKNARYSFFRTLYCYMVTFHPLSFTCFDKYYNLKKCIRTA